MTLPAGSPLASRRAPPRHRAALTGSTLVHLALLGLLLWFGGPRRASDPGPAAEPFEMVFEPAPFAVPEPPPAVPFDPAPPEAAASDAPLPPAEPAPVPFEPSPPAAVPPEAPAPPDVAEVPPPPVAATPAPPQPSSPPAVRRPPAPLPPRLPARSKPQPDRAAPASEPHPPAIAAQPAPVLPAPGPASPPSAAAAISPSWRRAVGAWLLEHKGYPEAARRRGEAGAVGVSFAVARDGRVGDAVVTSSSGSTILDGAVLALLSGHQVPPFPADMPQAEVRIAVRVVYTLE